MTTLAWLLIIAAILLAITHLGLAVRRRETPDRPHELTKLRRHRTTSQSTEETSRDAP
jgi:hypothetical protein